MDSSDRNIGLIMDALTFAFLMVQLRVFKSPYFTHAQHYLKVLIETSAQGGFNLIRGVAMGVNPFREPYNARGKITIIRQLVPHQSVTNYRCRCDDHEEPCKPEN